MTPAELAARTQIEGEAVDAALARMKGLARVGAAGQSYVIPESAKAALMDKIEEVLSRHHKEDPTSTGIDKQALRDRILRGAAPKLWDALLGEAASAGRVQLAGNLVRHPKAAVSALEAEGDARDRLAAYFAEAGITPEDLKNVPAATGLDATVVRKVLPKMLADGELVRVTPEMYFATATVEQVKTRLVEYLEKDGEITPAGFRDLIGAARKQALPLLGFFDARGLTVRDGDVRRLKKE